MEKLDDAIDRVYEAAVIPTHWGDFLRRFATLAESQEAVIGASSGGTFKWIGSSPVAEKLAVDHYDFHGGRERTRRLLELNRAGFATDFDVFSADEMVSLDLYKDYLLPRGFGRGVATVVSLPEGEVAVLHAEGSQADGPYSADLVARLDRLRPHLARSLALSSRLSFERVHTAVDVLSGLGYPACAVRSSGQVLLANAAFATVPSMWTTRFGERIALMDERADKQLAGALFALSSNRGIGSVAIPADEDGGAAVLHVVPVRRSAQDLFSQSMAILVLVRAKVSSTERVGLIKALYDLSPTEADIASRIASGQSVNDIASTAQKSVETVRNQLKTIFRKTGCNRQADLTRLLMNLQA